MKEDNYTYVVDFDGIYFAEGDLFENYEFTSENARKVRGFKGTTEPLQADELNETIKDIFLEGDYKQMLEFNAHIEIEIIMDDDSTPFIYRACYIE